MKTPEQEKLEGNPGRRNLKDTPQNLSTKIPTAPKHLDAVGKRFYHDIERLCGQEMKCLASTDVKAMEMLSDAYAEYRAIKKLLATMGDRYYVSKREIKTSTDQDTGEETITESLIIKKHPAVTDQQNAWSRVMQGLIRFGLTPSDRKNINIINPETGIGTSRKDDLKKKRDKIKADAKKMAAEGQHIKAV